MKHFVVKVSLLALIGSCWLATGLLAQAPQIPKVQPDQGFCEFYSYCDLLYCGWECEACCGVLFADCVYLASQEWLDCLEQCDPESPEYEYCVSACDYWHVTKMSLCYLQLDLCSICCEPCQEPCP